MVGGEGGAVDFVVGAEGGDAAAQGAAEAAAQGWVGGEGFDGGGEGGVVAQRGAVAGDAVFHHFGDAGHVVADDGGFVEASFEDVVADARAVVACQVGGVEQDVGGGEIGVQIAHRAEKGDASAHAQGGGLRFERGPFFPFAGNVQAGIEAALQEEGEGVEGEVDGADFVQARQRAEGDVAARRFLRRGGYRRQGVVGVGGACGGEAVADEFVALVAAVGDEENAEAGKQAGDFGIGGSVEAAGVVEGFGLRRGGFGGEGAGGDDARHLAVDDVRLLASQQFGKRPAGFEVACRAAVEIEGLPTDSCRLRLCDERAVGGGEDDVVAAPREQGAQTQAGGFRAAQPAHGGGEDDFHAWPLFSIAFKVSDGLRPSEKRPSEKAAGMCAFRRPPVLFHDCSAADGLFDAFFQFADARPSEAAVFLCRKQHDLAGETPGVGLGRDDYRALPRFDVLPVAAVFFVEREAFVDFVERLARRQPFGHRVLRRQYGLGLRRNNGRQRFFFNGNGFGGARLRLGRGSLRGLFGGFLRKQRFAFGQRQQHADQHGGGGKAGIAQRHARQCHAAPAHAEAFAFGVGNVSGQHGGGSGKQRQQRPGQNAADQAGGGENIVAAQGGGLSVGLAHGGFRVVGGAKRAL